MRENIEHIVSLTVDMIKASGYPVPDIGCMREKDHQMSYLRAHFPAEWTYACAKVRGARRSRKVIGRVSIREVGEMIRQGRRVTSAGSFRYDIWGNASDYRTGAA